jgi:DNA-binding transcriptional LysR family regulator
MQPAAIHFRMTSEHRLGAVPLVSQRPARGLALRRGACAGHHPADGRAPRGGARSGARAWCCSRARRSGCCPPTSRWRCAPMPKPWKAPPPRCERAATSEGESEGQGVRGVVRISVSEVIGVEVLPPIVARLREAHPAAEGRAGADQPRAGPAAARGRHCRAHGAAQAGAAGGAARRADRAGLSRAPRLPGPPRHAAQARRPRRPRRHRLRPAHGLRAQRGQGAPSRATAARLSRCAATATSTQLALIRAGAGIGMCQAGPGPAQRRRAGAPHATRFLVRSWRPGSRCTKTCATARAAALPSMHWSTDCRQYIDRRRSKAARGKIGPRTNTSTRMTEPTAPTDRPT